MIIGDKFVWGHFQKTGGTAIDRMFRVINDGTLKFDPQNKHTKHDTFSQRIKQKVELPYNRILNFRRLPEWIISFLWFNERCTRIKYKKENYKDGYIRDRDGGQPDKSLIWRNIDGYLASYMDNGIQYWLKTDSLNEDFISIIGKFIIINDKQKEEIMELTSVGKGHYDKSKEYFTKDEIKKFYHDCPLWTSIEKKLYGNLLV